MNFFKNYYNFLFEVIRAIFFKIIFFDIYFKLGFCLQLTAIILQLLFVSLWFFGSVAHVWKNRIILLWSFFLYLGLLGSIFWVLLPLQIAALFLLKSLFFWACIICVFFFSFFEVFCSLQSPLLEASRAFQPFVVY